LLFALIVVPELKETAVKFVQFTFAAIVDVPATVTLAASSIVNAPFAPPVIVTSVHTDEDPEARFMFNVDPATFALIAEPLGRVIPPTVEVIVNEVTLAAVHVNVPANVHVSALITGVMAVSVQN
jgi:hypothetical protein